MERSGVRVEDWLSRMNGEGRNDIKVVEVPPSFWKFAVRLPHILPRSPSLASADVGKLNA